MELERDKFEEVALAHFVAQRAAGVQISGDNGCEPTRESLFWRDANGDYGVRMFNAAWWGWKEAGRNATALRLDKMVTRFLGWELPESFAPDCHISFCRPAALDGSWPIGTNLLTAEQARAMFEYVTEGDVGNPIAAPAPADIAQPATENVAQWLGPYKDGAEALNELRKACAEMLGCDVDTWPSHDNAPLAIAAALGLRDNKAKTADQLKTALNELVNRTAPICESNCGPGMDAAFWDARRVLGLL